MYAIYEVVVYYSNWNEGVWSYQKLNEDVPPGPKLNGAMLFVQSWFSLLEFTQIFPIYGNMFNLTKFEWSCPNLLKFH